MWFLDAHSPWPEWPDQNHENYTSGLFSRHEWSSGNVSDKVNEVVRKSHCWCGMPIIWKQKMCNECHIRGTR